VRIFAHNTSHALHPAARQGDAQQMTMKPGTRIETLGTAAFGTFPGVAPERARVVKPRAENLPLPGPGWHIVQYETGGKLCMHESGFRVISN
jgi:hypothetical protein